MKAKGVMLPFLVFCVINSSQGQFLEIRGRIVAGDGIGLVSFKKQLLPKQEFDVFDSVVVHGETTFTFKFDVLEPGYYQISYKDGKTVAASPVLFDQAKLNLQVIIDTTSFLTKHGRVYGRKIKLNGV